MLPADPDALTLALSQGEKESYVAAIRIKPPADVIKLVDRLQYVLQPSLESLLAEGLAGVPVRPFPFQFEGVAFLSRVRRRSWPTRWASAKRCRPSQPSASCSSAASCRACCWSAQSRW